MNTFDSEQLRKALRHRSEIEAKGGNPPPRYQVEALAAKYGITITACLLMAWTGARGLQAIDDGHFIFGALVVGTALAGYVSAVFGFVAFIRFLADREAGDGT